MTGNRLEQYLDIAESASLAAGRYLSGKQSETIRVDSAHGKDIKLAVDRGAERIILDILQSKTDAGIISEETGTLPAGGSGSRLKWVVDPLDGSLNYSRGIPGCCVSIGLLDGNTPLLGVIHDFNRHETFSGIAGKWAALNGNPIHVSSVRKTEDAILFTGFPAHADYSEAALGRVVDQVRMFKKVRMIGSAALSLSYVAAGRGDTYLEKGIMLWDVVAGLAVLSGAGGTYTMEKTPIPQAHDVFASANDGLNTRARKPIDTI